VYYELAKTKERFDTKVICDTVSGSVGLSKANLPSISEAHSSVPPVASLTRQAKGLTKRSKVKILQRYAYVKKIKKTLEKDARLACDHPNRGSEKESEAKHSRARPGEI